ncbi:hypothetical protein [Faecalibacillus faecis]|uniref:hypothetical protein n=1 Tax=Faecalibacillus faecis TaxID=1982628 RepID=UPI00386D273E
MDFFINKCIPVFSLVLSLVSTIIAYKSLHSNKDDKRITNVRILQINPSYFYNHQDVQYSQTKYISNEDNTYRNKRWIINIVYFFYLAVICISFMYMYLSVYDYTDLVSFVSSLNKMTSGQILNITKTCLFYMILSMLVYSFSIFLLFYNRKASVINNIIAMKYYVIKCISDIFSLVIIHNLTVININDSLSYLIYLIALLILMLFQFTWFDYSLKKAFLDLKSSTYIPEKMYQFFSYFPVYLSPIVLYYLIKLV